MTQLVRHRTRPWLGHRREVREVSDAGGQAEDVLVEPPAAVGHADAGDHGEEREEYDEPRKEASRPPLVKAAKRDRAPARELVEEERRDQEAAQDEEEVDSEVAGGGDPTGVVQHDCTDRDCA